MGSQEINSFPRRHFREIRFAYWFLNILNTVTAISLLLLLKFTEIDVGNVYLVLATLPLDIYVFSWEFHKVVTWKDPDKTGQLPHGYICLGFRSPLFILFFVNVLFVLYPMIYSSFQCIHGGKYLNFVTFAIFAVLFLVSVLLLPERAAGIRQKLEAYFTIAMFSFCFSWALAYAVFYASSEQTDLYAAVAVDSYESRNRGPSYYVSVELKDGSKQSLHISESLYRYTQEYKAVLIHERTSLFGATFVDVHNPLEYLEEETERIKSRNENDE